MPPYVPVTPATLRAQAAKEREAMQESEAELAARHAGQENAGADEEEPAPEPTADLITGPGRYLSAEGVVREIVGRGDRETEFEEWRATNRYEFAKDGRHCWAPGCRNNLIAPIPASLSDAEAADYAKLYAPLYAEAIRRGETPEQAREYARERVEKKAEPVVIDGPGEYEMLWDNEPCIGTVEYQRPDGKWYVTGYPNCISGTAFFSDGAHYGRDDYPQHRIVRKVPSKHVPAPRLEEEIGEGLWWAVNPESGERFKVHVRESAINGLWLLEGWRPIGDGFVERFAVQTQADFDGEFFVGSCEGQLVRRVQSQERSLTPAEAFRLIGERVSRKFASGEWEITHVGRFSVRLFVCGGGKAERYVEFRDLKDHYIPNGDFSLSVVESSGPWDEPND